MTRSNESKTQPFSTPISTAGAVDVSSIPALLHQCTQDIILPGFQKTQSTKKPDGSLVTAIDLQSQNFMTEALHAIAPKIPLLGEEMEETEQQELLSRLSDSEIWCLDPLDGTSNFATGIPMFGISLALLDQKGPKAGWIYDPVRDELFIAIRGQGAWLNGKPLRSKPAPELPRCIGALDYKRLRPAMRERLAVRPPFHSQRNFGSSVLEWCWLAAGRFHFYIHGGQKLWDYSAGLLLLQEAGGRASELDGHTIGAPRLRPLPLLATLDPDLHDIWTAWLAQANGSEAGNPANS